MFDKGRFQAITDGIAAVAATIMVMKLDVPDHASLAAALEQAVLMILSGMVSREDEIEIQDRQVIRTTRRVTLAAYALAAVTAVCFSRLSLPIILAGIGVNLVIIWRYDVKQCAGRKE